jgi:ABC-2 type transport system permease protein
MSTLVTDSDRRDAAPILPMLRAQVWSVLLFYIRIPYFTIFSVGLPIMFFCFFGLPKLHTTMTAGVSVGAYVLASMAAYSMSNVLVYNIGIGQANQRARKLDLLQRATPLPGWIALAANMVGGIALALLGLVGLLAVGAIAGVSLPLERWALLVVAVVYGSLPMLGLGLLLGNGTGPNVAPALASIIYLPMAFASGLFIPLQQMPDFIQKFGTYLPLYHLGQLGWNVVGNADEPAWQAVLWVAGWSIVFLLAAARAFRIDQLRKFS